MHICATILDFQLEQKSHTFQRTTKGVALKKTQLRQSNCTTGYGKHGEYGIGTKITNFLEAQRKTFCVNTMTSEQHDCGINTFKSTIMHSKNHTTSNNH